MNAFSDANKSCDKRADAASYTLGPLQSGPPCCDPKPLLSVEDLSLRYGNKTALENVSLEIHQGCTPH